MRLGGSTASTPVLCIYSLALRVGVSAYLGPRRYWGLTRCNEIPLRTLANTYDSPGQLAGWNRVLTHVLRGSFGGGICGSTDYRRLTTMPSSRVISRSEIGDVGISGSS